MARACIQGAACCRFQVQPRIAVNSLSLILLLVAVGWFWLDSLRARELATGIASEMCRRRGLQFLDQTVALVRLGLRRTPAGLRLRRLYRFDYSEQGFGRHTGHIIMLGTQVEELSLGLPSQPVADRQVPPVSSETEQRPPPESTDHGKILPFRRPKSR
jgi:hypothetical protein